MKSVKVPTVSDPSRSANWHAMETVQALERLEADLAHGLTEQEAARRLERHGPNRLAPKKGKPVWLLFLSQFNQPLVYILLAAGAVTAALQEWVDSAVIFGVVAVNAVMGFLQETNALKAIDALARNLSVDATVIRSGTKRTVSATELVPGDIVALHSGDKVPADVRLMRARELQIDESALTGESVPVEKQTAALPADTVLADRANMAYSTTLVTYGSGLALVVETGDRTEIGRINQMIATARILETPLTQKISHFSKRLMWVILGFAAVTFLVGWQRGESALDMFMASVALVVGAIPEGLPAALTITLAIGVSRMAKRNAIIRKLPAVETLGSTTVICSDKTGTLTQNQMTVVAVYADGEHFEVTGSGYAPAGEFRQAGTVIDPRGHGALMECLRAGLLCNDARLIEGVEGWSVEGDPTEGALLVSARKAGLHELHAGESHPRLDTLPFESQHQFMATLHHDRAENARYVYLKGSAESILKRCDAAFDRHMGVMPLDATAIHAEVEAMAAQGLRVLAFARGDRCVGEDRVVHPTLQGGLVFLGLQGMIDPPRPEAVEAIAACQRAGIRVKMITGDHPGTASAIARQLGLVREGRLHRLFGVTLRGRVLTGAELQGLDEEAYRRVVEHCDIYARVAPEQKLDLVRALQARGNVVAMTGDGVNDAPALRQADIGVAMGRAGTEVAKEAAAMVLTDDNFATIEAAVEEGRGVFDNLMKFITWTLPTNVGEGLVITVAVFGGVALPILPVQILWINMSTAVLLGLMLAFEANEPGIMHRRPRDPRQPILTRTLLFRIFVVGLLLLVGAFGLFEWALGRGDSLETARTTAVAVFVFGEMFYLFNCRSLEYSMFHVGVFSNPRLLVGVLAMAALQLLFTYWPPMNRAFASAPIGAVAWVLVLAVSLAIHAVVGIEKWMGRRWANP
ncbi:MULTISPECIES: cation-transporting P-type ATPase [Methylococcus]|jgi:cation-transporting ATPase F|uniref:Cation-transporting ATPase F n=1 Tax=Methylococcus capsulatus TaxID=414 RepID=A0AA35UX26_METCP|nr:cation-transporting P-type ATPase [Methylococcus capsulatus]CAI8871063.1 putative cation-transporting ATPase F [Methylococcus capsulatus]